MPGVIVQNVHLKNSELGIIVTDEAPWGDGVAEKIGKAHGLCRYHKADNIMKSSSGLTEGLGQQYISDVSSTLYGDHSLEELNKLFDLALAKYGHADKPKRFLNNLILKQGKLCHAHQKWIFNLGHSTTQRGESKNSGIKGNGDLIDYLSTCNLVEMNMVIDELHRRYVRRAIKELGRLRRESKRVSAYYTAHYNKSVTKSALDVVSCEITMSNTHKVIDKKGLISFVNLDYKVAHRGNVYTIFSCTCSFWMQRKIHCKCIVRACIVAGKDPESIVNVFPYWHIQRSPLWALALKEQNMEDYTDDFTFDNTPSLTPIADSVAQQ